MLKHESKTSAECVPAMDYRSRDTSALSGAEPWTPIDRKGLPVGDEQALSFPTPIDAAKYALSVGLFEVEHG